MRYLILFFLMTASIHAEPLFDPNQVAKEETAAWKDYYNNDITALTQDLAHLVIAQFRISEITAWSTVIPQLALSAKEFKDLPNTATRAQYNELVLPHLVKVYKTIKDSLKGSWDPVEAANDELEWWIYRREIPMHDPEIVGRKIANLYTLIYGADKDGHFVRAGYLRAVAARYRDICEHTWHKVEDTDWVIIETLLEKSYQELVLGIK